MHKAFDRFSQSNQDTVNPLPSDPLSAPWSTRPQALERGPSDSHWRVPDPPCHQRIRRAWSMLAGRWLRATIQNTTRSESRLYDHTVIIVPLPSEGVTTLRQ